MSIYLNGTKYNGVYISGKRINGYINGREIFDYTPYKPVRPNTPVQRFNVSFIFPQRVHDILQQNCPTIPYKYLSNVTLNMPCGKYSVGELDMLSGSLENYRNMLEETYGQQAEFGFGIYMFVEIIVFAFVEQGYINNKDHLAKGKSPNLDDASNKEKNYLVDIEPNMTLDLRNVGFEKLDFKLN